MICIVRTTRQIDIKVLVKSCLQLTTGTEHLAWNLLQLFGQSCDAANAAYAVAIIASSCLPVRRVRLARSLTVNLVETWTKRRVFSFSGHSAYGWIFIASERQQPSPDFALTGDLSAGWHPPTSHLLPTPFAWLVQSASARNPGKSQSASVRSWRRRTHANDSIWARLIPQTTHQETINTHRNPSNELWIYYIS